MLLAYIHCFSTQTEYPELCLIADKPDHMSVPARIEALIPTEAAVLRLGPVEAAKVSIDPEDGGKIIEPVNPAKLFLSPSLPDRPGVQVGLVKVIKVDEGRFQTYYCSDRDRGKKGAWRPFTPNEMQF